MERRLSEIPVRPGVKKCRIVVIRGGRSSEREISLETGRNVEAALASRGHEVKGMDLDISLFDLLVKKEVDLAFVALHGKWGEDGTLQGLLEILDIPYTGSGVLASALAMDKRMAKRIMESAGLPTPAWAELGSPEEAREKGNRIGYPLVVKPARSGSTVGISIVEKERELAQAVEKAFAEDRHVFLEAYIAGRELTVGVLGNDPFALPVIELVPPEGGFYDYENKYTPGRTRHLIPAPINSEISEKAQRLAVEACRLIGCRGFARVDMRLDPEGGLHILEVNTVPGMTRLSLLPEAARAGGISFEDLVELLVEWGLQPR